MNIADNYNSVNIGQPTQSPAFSSLNDVMADLEKKLLPTSFSLDSVKPGEDIKFKDDLFSSGAFYCKSSCDITV